jgi:hypothetical protein
VFGHRSFPELLFLRTYTSGAAILRWPIPVRSAVSAPGWLGMTVSAGDRRPAIVRSNNLLQSSDLTICVGNDGVEADLSEHVSPLRQ